MEGARPAVVGVAVVPCGMTKKTPPVLTVVARISAAAQKASYAEGKANHVWDPSKPFNDRYGPSENFFGTVEPDAPYRAFGLIEGGKTKGIAMDAPVAHTVSLPEK